MLTLWFSASAVAPQLESDWGLTSGQAAGLTIAVQFGFVVGALASALFSVADVIPARRLFVLSAIVGAGVNVPILALGAALGIAAMVALKRPPQATELAGGAG